VRRWKKALSILLFLSLIFPANSLFADTFDIFKDVYFTLCIADYGTTVVAMQQPEMMELNPIARYYVNQPELFTPITLGLMIVQDWGFKKLHKWNKTFAYIFLGALTALKMYAVFNNIDAIRHSR
jgi:hypothetical protein